MVRGTGEPTICLGGNNNASLTLKPVAGFIVVLREVKHLRRERFNGGVHEGDIYAFNIDDNGSALYTECYEIPA